MAIALSRFCADFGPDEFDDLTGKICLEATMPDTRLFHFSRITKNNESDLSSGQSERLLILLSPQ